MRTAYLGPYQEGYLTGNAIAVQHVAELAGPGDYAAAVPWLFYASLLQAGVDQIMIGGSGRSLRDVGPAIERRIKREDSDERARIYSHVESIFSDAGVKLRRDLEPDPIFDVLYFLGDILLAAHQGYNLVWMSEIPDIAKIPSLPGELSHPIRNLLSQFQTVTPTTVAPQLKVRRQDVLLFEEILSSAPFRKYGRSHDVLADTRRLLGVASAEVSAHASTVAALNRGLLIEHKSVAVVLDASAKMIDVLGKVPGVLAGVLAASLTTLLEERARLVIYDVAGIVQENTRAALRHMNQQNPES